MIFMNLLLVETDGSETCPILTRVKGKIRPIHEKVAIGKMERGGSGAKSFLAKPPRLCCIAEQGVRVSGLV